MNHSVRLGLACAVIFLASSLFAAQEGRGLRMFDQNVKKACGSNAFEVAQRHTQAEWKAIYEANRLDAEFKTFCPEAKPFKEEYKEDVYAFLFATAKDSGRVIGGC